MKGGVYTVGEIIKSKRLKMGLLQSDVAVKLGIDAPLLSKIEKGERNAKREQVAVLSKLFKMEENELLSIWLADKIYEFIKNEDVAFEAISKAEKKMRNNRRKK
jgi:transcriptional regulator with XRE-family HTH domain